MGEVVQKIEITFPPEAVENFARMLREIVNPPQAGTPVHARTPYDVGLEPWAFHSPSHGCDVMAYIDDRNQVRHVPTSRTSEVPKAWRRVWIEAAG